MRIASELGPGLELSGSIRLEKKLAEGGMGSVWTAQHLALKTQVAVKFLAAHLAQDAAAAARFQREAMAAARIKSPHVVQIFDHGMSTEHGPYIVMELLEGETLSAFVQRHGRLSPPLTARILAQLCRALAKAHAHGIVHRDIKPDNVFLHDADREPFVKVLDFGIAKNLQDEMSVTSTGSMMGTPHYMSPEQMLSSKHVDLRADLWASAVLAYHCITGGVPFDGETFGAVAIAVTLAEFTPPFARHGVGSAALDAWFAKALARDLNARFASAEEFSEAFSQASDGWRGATNATGSGHALTGAAAAAALGTNPGQPAPTFNGVATTMARGRPRGGLVAAGSLAALFVLVGAGLVLLKTHEVPPTPIAATVTPHVGATPLPPATVPAASSATQAEPTPPPAVSAPAPSAKRIAPPPRQNRPVTPPPAPASRPDRGF